MRIIHTSTKIKKKFSLDELKEVSTIVRNNYDPASFNCIQIAELLSDIYFNLIPVTIKCMVHDGTIQRSGHVVSNLRGTDTLIDATGDYVNYTNSVRLSHEIVPWVYQRDEETGLYLSQNHIPFSFSEKEKGQEGPITELDIVRITSSPFYKGLRSITI